MTVLWLMVLLFANSSLAMLPMLGMFGGMGMRGDSKTAEVYPFLSYSGMPAKPGKLNLRLNRFSDRLGAVSANGYSAHFEAGLIERLGLHIRNDNFQLNGTELMFQFSLLGEQIDRDGLAFTAGYQFPGTTAEAVSTYKVGLTGIRSIWGHPLHFSLNYNAQNSVIDLAASQILSLSDKFALLVEYANSRNRAYILGGLKMNILAFADLGIGYQVPVSMDKDFDSRLLIQAEFGI